MSDSNWTFSQGFLAQFQTSRSALESRINSAKSTPVSLELLQAISVELATLAKSLADATGSLPSYDQRQCESKLKVLEKALEGLRTSEIHKPRFAFKHKPKTTPSATSSSPTIAPILDIATSPKPSNDSNMLSTNLSLSSHSNCYLTLDSLPDSLLLSKHSDLTVSDLENCIVNLIPPVTGLGKDQEHLPSSCLDISALHIQKLADTVLLLPVIRGSVLLHDLARCVIVVGCHQFRMHNSSDVDVYLSISSNPIIEHCSNIRFAFYPKDLSSQASDEKASNHLSVQDFSHIRSTPSPHWSILANEERIEAWPSSLIEGKGHFDKILRSLLPAPQPSSITNRAS